MPHGAPLILLLLLLLLLPWGSHCTTGAEGPSPCPIRREEPVERAGQTCQRSCRQDQDCSGQRQCLCDGSCGLSCVTPNRSCPWPVQVENAETHLTQVSHSFGALMEVTCHPGFSMSKGQRSELSRCQGDRKWSWTEPCEWDLSPSSFCRPPPEIDNGSRSGPPYRPGREVQYKCKRGYRLEGSATLRCQDNQEWSGPTPTCHPVFCPPPGDIAEGYLVAVKKAQYRAGELVYYLCKRNYLLDGTNRVTCQDNGTWSPQPFCRARCAVLAQRSRVLYQGRKLWVTEIPEGLVQHGENVTFYCRQQNQTQRQSCSYPTPERCLDGVLPLPACYEEPTWLQYMFFPKRVVSEIRPC
ncbi:beta-2-glycoprotein 1-like [Carettochelys insculpta]|uniref:beta-2-glycoprotein 1-like n=1 Tax=Carettochelys insculpta TaxID=44489 RepID=UPI003EBA9B4E